MTHRKKNTENIEEGLSVTEDGGKRFNIRLIGSLQKKKDYGIETILEETAAENFPDLMKESNSQTQESQRTPGRISGKKSIPIFHIIVKLQN